MVISFIVGLVIALLGYILGGNVGFKLGYSQGVKDYQAYMHIMQNPSEFLREHSSELNEKEQAQVLEFVKRKEKEETKSE